MYGAIFLVYGLHVPYLAVWLSSRELTPAEIGWILSLPLFARLVLTPLIAMLADEGGRHARTILQLAVVGLAATVALGLVNGAVAIAVAVLVMMVALQSTMPLIEVVALRNSGAGQSNYGRQRLWGSITFIVSTLIGGTAIAEIGGWSIQPLMVAATATVVAASFALVASADAADGERQCSSPAADRVAPAQNGNLGRRLHAVLTKRLRALQAILRQPGLFGVLVGAGAIQASHAVYYVFSALHWQSVGFSGLLIGILWSIGVIAEIVLFARSGRLVSTMEPQRLLLAGAGAALVRWTAMAFDPGPAALIALQALHAFTFGATHLAAVLFIARNVPQEHAGAVQALFGTFATGIAMGLATLAAGYLYAQVQEQAYLAMALIGAVATVFAAWLVFRPGQRGISG